MTELIEQAMAEEWAAAYPGKPMPEVSRDRIIMFAAIAKGVLRYLHQQRVQIGTTDPISSVAVPNHTHTLVFDVVEDP
jgi:hypothetical protein